jgi:HAMP domain-containing protein
LVSAGDTAATNYTDNATGALSRVAHTGAYGDLSGAPSIPSTGGLITATQATNIAQAVVAPYTNHQDRTDNPHTVTAGQVGAMTGAATSNVCGDAVHQAPTLPS